MKVKLSVTIAVVGAVLILYSLYVPWLSFNGLIRQYQEAYEVSGNTYALGIGTLNRTSGKVTVWSRKYWSSAGSDFWFGWLSIAGGVLVFCLRHRLQESQKPADTYVACPYRRFSSYFGFSFGYSVLPTSNVRC